MIWRSLSIAACGIALLGGCDAVRYPGDGGEPPRTPPTVDPDAPPPPPPSEPVLDPYGTGETGGEDDLDPLPVSDPVDTGDTLAPPAVDEPVEFTFSYFAPGSLTPGSGTGAPDQIVHAPGLVFPIRTAPAYLQSMVWGFGGGVGGGDECDPRNYTYPWRDNFCETRTSNRSSPFCPLGRIHQGQDIRVGTPSECEILRGTAEDDRMLHEVVAVEDGVVYEIGTYTVKLRSGGRIFRYMHLNMDALQVSAGDSVLAGDVLGYVSKDFGGTPTTFHLHFEIIQNTEEHGWVHVPPYLSLVEAYERREGGPGEFIDTAIAAASAPVFPPDDLIIIE
ncbi:MAG: M23 family metallopeptidase [Pseudomonadota bacterium]